MWKINVCGQFCTELSGVGLNEHLNEKLFPISGINTVCSRVLLSLYCHSVSWNIPHSDATGFTVTYVCAQIASGHRGNLSSRSSRVHCFACRTLALIWRQAGETIILVQLKPFMHNKHNPKRLQVLHNSVLAPCFHIGAQLKNNILNTDISRRWCGTYWLRWDLSGGLLGSWGVDLHRSSSLVLGKSPIPPAESPESRSAPSCCTTQSLRSLVASSRSSHDLCLMLECRERDNNRKRIRFKKKHFAVWA